MVVKMGSGERTGGPLYFDDIEKVDAPFAYNDSLPPRQAGAGGGIHYWGVSKAVPDSVRFSILSSSSPRRSEPPATH